MAIITIYHDEAEGDEFPRLCMRCGEETELLVPHKFAWMPGWIPVLLFVGVGILPWLILVFVMRKTMRVMVPMCDRHVNHWQVRSLYIWAGLVFWIVFGTSLGLLSGQLPADLVNGLAGFCLIGVIIWLVVGVVLASGTIRPLEIGKFGMDLGNVNKQFAVAWKEICEEASARRRAARRARKKRRALTSDDTDPLELE